MIGLKSRQCDWNLATCARESVAVGMDVFGELIWPKSSKPIWTIGLNDNFMRGLALEFVLLSVWQRLGRRRFSDT